MIISLAQTKIIWEDKAQNIAIAETIIKEQVNRSSKLVLFPEMSFTGFSMNTELTSESNNETCKEMTTLAQKYKVSIGFGWVRRIDIKCENVYTIINDDGSIISEYVKIHPFSYSGEDRAFKGGGSVSVFDLHDSRTSIFICYDLRFPEVFRKICKDATLGIVPANWPVERAEHWATLLRARAIENQMYIFGINCQGNIGGKYYSGGSCVINPDGVVLERLCDTSGVITYDFQDDAYLYRKNFPVLKDIIAN